MASPKLLALAALAALAAAAAAAAAASAERTITITNRCAAGGTVITTLGTGQTVAAPPGGWRLEAGASFTRLLRRHRLLGQLRFLLRRPGRPLRLRCGRRRRRRVPLRGRRPAHAGRDHAAEPRR